MHYRSMSHRSRQVAPLEWMKSADVCEERRLQENMLNNFDNICNNASFVFAHIANIRLGNFQQSSRNLKVTICRIGHSKAIQFVTPSGSDPQVIQEDGPQIVPDGDQEMRVKRKAGLLSRPFWPNPPPCFRAPLKI